jgi:hypothetical protein
VMNLKRAAMMRKERATAVIRINQLRVVVEVTTPMTEPMIRPPHHPLPSLLVVITHPLAMRIKKAPKLARPQWKTRKQKVLGKWRRVLMRQQRIPDPPSVLMSSVPFLIPSIHAGDVIESRTWNKWS